jgi:hypothetical protein
MNVGDLLQRWSNGSWAVLFLGLLLHANEFRSSAID